MLEDPRKRQRISFVTDISAYTRLAKKNSFIGRRILDENAALIKNKRVKTTFDKPTFIGVGNENKTLHVTGGYGQKMENFGNNFIIYN